jgi:hypothetical protein
LAGLITCAGGCTSVETSAAADQVAAFALDSLRQVLAAFLL